jgi:hypothetical protein
MKTTLTPLKTFNLTINGVVFENMKQTGELDGITELSNGTTKATLLCTGSNFGGFFDSLFSDGVRSDWVPLRGTPDIQKAAAIVQATTEKEPTVLRSDFDLCMQDKNRCIKLIEDVHALLCAGKDTHAKELLEKRVNNQTVDIPPFIFNRQHKPT